jgi:hypothetical protein
MGWTSTKWLLWNVSVGLRVILSSRPLACAAGYCIGSWRRGRCGWGSAGARCRSSCGRVGRRGGGVLRPVGLLYEQRFEATLGQHCHTSSAVHGLLSMRGSRQSYHRFQHWSPFRVPTASAILLHRAPVVPPLPTLVPVPGPDCLGNLAPSGTVELNGLA